MPALLAAADVCLVPLRDVPLFRTFIPSKMFECLAAGKAVVGSVRGEAAQILTEAGAVVVPPEDSAALAAAIADLAAAPRRRAQLGQLGRSFVERCYDRAALAREYRKVLDQAAASRGDDSPSSPGGARWPRLPARRARGRRPGGAAMRLLLSPVGTLSRMGGYPPPIAPAPRTPRGRARWQRSPSYRTRGRKQEELS